MKFLILSTLSALLLLTLTVFFPSKEKFISETNKVLIEKHLTYSVIKDISYANASDFQKLDIYLPSTKKYAYPVIIAIHGGAFMSGDKNQLPKMAMFNGLERGFAVVAVNYRLSSESKFPSQIQDVKEAIKWVKLNAVAYHLDPTKIVLWGASAGAHLACLAGTTQDLPIFQNTSSNLNKYDTRVNVVVDWFGPINFLAMDEQLKNTKRGIAKHDSLNSAESKFIGVQITKNVKLVRSSNPELYISPNDPYFFIQHGTMDPLVPVQQSTYFFHRLEGKLGEEKVDIKLIQGAKHGGREFDQKENIDLTFRFIERHLK